jgi:hypothetical protein
MPTSNELLDALRQMLTGGGCRDDEEFIVRYVRAFKALDEALTKGEPMPDAWAPKTNG